MAKRQQVLERNKGKVVGLILEGLSDAGVAAALSDKGVTVSRQAVTAFRHRHARELGEAKQAMLKAVEDFAIAHKVNRIAALDERWKRMQALIEAGAEDTRYSDEPGYQTGLMVHQLKSIGKGEDFQLVHIYVTDTSLLAEMRATERAAAEELAQLARPEVNVSNATNYVFMAIGPEEAPPLG